MLVPTFQKKAPLSASDLNILGDAVRRARVLPGVGIKLTETLNGTIVSLKPSRGAGGSENPERRPWDIVNLRGIGEPNQDGVFPSYEAEVWPGTLAAIMPGNLFTSGELTTFTVPSSLTKWKGRVTTDGKQVTTVTIVADAQDPPTQVLVPSALPATADFVFGLTLNGQVFRTIGNGNPSVSFNQAIVTDKTSPPPPGVPGVDRWYRLNFA
jgi:hypothetical protein